MSGGNFPVSNQFMIGDYVMPGNVVQLDQPSSIFKFVRNPPEF
jgi:hypothetical protein